MTLFRRFSSHCSHTFLADTLSAASVVVDLGANEGDFSTALHRTFGCRVVAVEPVPALATRLRGLGLGSVHQAVIGSAATPEVLYLFPHRCAAVRRIADGAEVEAVAVPVRRMTLAELWTAEAMTRIHLLKVDIEGAELDMFTAMTAADFSRIDQITVEFHDFLYPETRPRVIETTARIAAHGFLPIRFSLDHTDVLFIHPERCQLSPCQYLLAKYLQRNIRGLVRRLRRIGR